MANSSNNRPPIKKPHFFDGINPTSDTFQALEDSTSQSINYVVNDFHGSGVLQKNPITLAPILDTSNPNPNNISFSSLTAGNYDGKGIFVDRQNVDNIFGDQLSITLENVDIPLYNPTKIVIFGKIYDPNLQQGKSTLETLVFNKSGTQTTLNYFKSVIAVFFNNFSGGVGRTDLNAAAQESKDVSAVGLTGKLTIREVSPLEVLDHSTVLNQTNTPNLDVRDFITSTISREFFDELTFVVNTAQNTNYVPVSLEDLNALPLDTSGVNPKPFLDSTNNGVIYGQKVLLPTNNIQQLSFALALENDAYGWSGELVLGVRPLQTKSTRQFANRIDLDPDFNVIFEASFTQDDLLNSGYVLSTTPQEIKFNFINTTIAQPGIVLIPDEYYIITISRRGSLSTGKIIIDAGPKQLTNSKFSTFNPNTKAWTDDPNNDLWFKVYSASIRVSSGVAYTNEGTMVSLQKTFKDVDGSINSVIAGPYSLRVVDASGSDNIVILQSTEAFEEEGQHPRTGNLVFLKIIDRATISILNSAEFTELVEATNNQNNDNLPLVLAIVHELNNKTNIVYNGVITFPGQVRTNQIILFNTNISDNLLEVNNVIMPNSSSPGIKYRIVKSDTVTQYLGDFNNDKVFTSSDLVEQLLVQDKFSAQSANTFTGTLFDPFSIFDRRSRDILGFNEESIERFILSDLDGYLIINAINVARLQYLTTTLPVFVTPAPTTISIQVLTVENTTSVPEDILITQITDIDGYAEATATNQIAFTAPSFEDMRALSIGDTVNLSVDNFTTTSYSDLKIEKFIQRNDLLIETRFNSDVLPTVDTAYILSFYDQNPVFNGKLGIFDEEATAVLEFVVPGLDLNDADIASGDIVKITNDGLIPARNGTYTVSKVINDSTFRVFTPDLPITAGAADGYIEFFASDGETVKLSDTAVVKFTVNTINLETSAIQEGDIVHITLGPVSLNGTYTVARVISSTEFTVVPPSPALIAQTFTATFEFRAAGDIIVKIPPTVITNAIIGSGDTPIRVVGMESLPPANLPDGVDTIFSFNTQFAPITGDVSVHWTSDSIPRTMTFFAAPVQILGDGNPENSSIDRTSGNIRIDTFLPPDDGSEITIDYRIAPTVVLKRCFPTIINEVSASQTDIEFKVPFINEVPNTDIQGVATSSFVIIQVDNAEPPDVVLNGSGNVVAGTVMVNTINPTDAITLPTRNMVLQLTDANGNDPALVLGSYWAQIYSGESVNLPAVQKEFLSNILSFASPVRWQIQKNNFEWRAADMVITDYRRFLPAAFITDVNDTQYTSKNETWLPSDLYIGKGEILGENGLPYHGDLEITQLKLDLPVTALLSNNINVYNTLIASYSATPGITRGGQIALKFSDGTYVGAEDVGDDTALSRNQVRIMAAFSSIYLDGYQVPNAAIYRDLDEVLTKLHYEVRSGMEYDNSTGILAFHIENIKAIFANEPIAQTGVFTVTLDVALKKSGFKNPVVHINSVDIGRLFTNPVEIIPIPTYSIAGQVRANFIVGKAVR